MILPISPSRAVAKDRNDTTSASLEIDSSAAPFAYLAATPVVLPSAAWIIPLLFMPEARAAEPADFVITSSSGNYDAGRFTGKVVARMRIPDLDKAARICAAEDLAAYRRFPGVREATYNDGILRYVLTTTDLGPISVRDMGYSLRLTTDRSRAAEGVVKVSWTNWGTQPTYDSAGAPLTNFLENDGSWTFKRIAGDLFEVVWDVSTVVNPETLQSGSWLISDDAIRNQTMKDTATVVRSLAELANE